MKPSDVLIIGGGVLGAFHAYHALKLGMSVTLLEKDGFPRGASVRNFGQVVPSGLDSTWQAHGRDSLKIYRSIQSEFDISVRQQGTIYIASDDEELALITELAEINRQNEYASELLTDRQCRQKFPLLRAEYCRGGLFFPEEMSVNPRRMIHRLHKYLAQQPNFRAHFQQSVIQLESLSENHVSALTGDGNQYEARRAIVCSGSEFRILFPQRFAESDLKAVKIQMLRLNPQPGTSIPGNVLTGLSIRRYESFAECPSWSAVKANEPSDQYWKKWGIHILFKQESDGSIILGDSHEYASAARTDELGFDIRRHINDHFIEEGRKIFDLPNWDIESSWFGIYCQTSDPSGILTQTVDDSIHIVTGIGGKGMTSSAGFAKYFIEKVSHA